MSEQPNAPVESPVKEGDVLAGKYRVERVLGVGGMGVVVAALHTELDERVALKFLLPSAAQNPSVVARFSREARAAAKIKSQHVARVSDVGTLETGVPYIVMEYLEGADLSAMLERQGRLPYGVAVDYVLQASEAIAEAHAAGFVHRDLKPGNLFLARQADGSHLVKVLDFGISKAVIADEPTGGAKQGSLTRTSDIFGSPMYMSPEQLKSSRDVDPRADIWALGVILYELVTGVSPFDRATVAETFGAILYEKPRSTRELVAEIPEELDHAILRCLEKDANGRFPNIAEMVKALLPFAKDATRATLDRTSRVLRNAGVSIASVPPPALGQAAARTGLPAGSQTRTNWDSASAVKPRSNALTAIAVVAGMAVAAIAMYAFLRTPAGASTNTGAKPEQGQPTTVATATPTVAPVTTTAPAPTETAAAQPTATAAPKPTVEPGPALPTGQRGKPGRPTKAGAAATAAAAPAPAPAPKPKPADDPDGFGDRK
jgi:serine/threonine-protein kinase